MSLHTTARRRPFPPPTAPGRQSLIRDKPQGVVQITLADLDALLRDKVMSALPVYNTLLARPFDPALDTIRIVLS